MVFGPLKSLTRENFVLGLLGTHKKYLQVSLSLDFLQVPNLLDC